MIVSYSGSFSFFTFGALRMAYYISVLFFFGPTAFHRLVWT